ncbi:hypothetical protein FKM82_020541 [Ascaphus truei]
MLAIYIFPHATLSPLLTEGIEMFLIPEKVMQQTCIGKPVFISVEDIIWSQNVGLHINTAVYIFTPLLSVCVLGLLPPLVQPPLLLQLAVEAVDHLPDMVLL